MKNEDPKYYCETHNENFIIKDAKTCPDYRKVGDACIAQSSRTGECTATRKFEPKYIPR